MVTFFLLRFRSLPICFKLHPTLMAGIYEKVRCLINNECCLVFSDRQLHRNEYD